MLEVIRVNQLSKKFLVRKNFPGILGAIKGFFHSKVIEVPAIQELCFSVRQGKEWRLLGRMGRVNQQQSKC